MRTLQEIKDEVAKELYHCNFDVLVFSNTEDMMIGEIAKRYATECCKASLEKAADKAKSNYTCSVWNCEGTPVNKQSINNEENIVLL